MKNPSVILADDHRVFLEGLLGLLQAEGFAVAGTATNGRDALELVQRLRPDVAVLDLAMPELNGNEVARQLSDSGSPTRVVMLSMLATREHVMRAMRAGAMAYVPKECAGADLAAAIRAVASGRRYLSAALGFTLPAGTAREGSSPLEALSQREREIMQLVVEGHTSAKIAETLGLSKKTVETYRCRLMRKLGVHNVPELVKYAIQTGVTPLAIA